MSSSYELICIGASPTGLACTIEAQRVPGVHLTGVVMAGNKTGEIFIEDGRFRGKQIIAALAGN